MDSLRLAPGIEVERLSDRRALLGAGQPPARPAGRRWRQGRRLSDQQHAAILDARPRAGSRRPSTWTASRSPFASGTAGIAFGQSLLLARRLVEAGVPVVQANMGRVQNWDTHGDNFPKLKNRLLPPLDQAVAALLDDLEAEACSSKRW